MKNIRLAAFLLAFPTPAVAHHSFAAEYDSAKAIEVTGVVTKLEWQNPHTWLYLDVTEPNGKIEHWAFSASPPGFLMRHGITKNDLKPGTILKVEGYKAKAGLDPNNSKNGYGRKVTFPDGRTVNISGNEN